MKNAEAVTLFLNTHVSRDVSESACARGPVCGATVVAELLLKKNVVYDIKVSGTVSAWSEKTWQYYGACGNPGGSPTFRSPGVANSVVGDDAQFRFAMPKQGTCPQLPLRLGGFQVRLRRRSPWVSPVAVGDPSKPVPDHTYSFRVLGMGQRPTFRYADAYSSDDDGEFRIRIALRHETPPSSVERAARLQAPGSIRLDGGLVPTSGFECRSRLDPEPFASFSALRRLADRATEPVTTDLGLLSLVAVAARSAWLQWVGPLSGAKYAAALYASCRLDQPRPRPQSQRQARTFVRDCS